MLAGVVITKNEEANIERCLKSLHFCDEIVVVDAHSSDRTREVALKYTRNVFVLSWEGYVHQKNHATSLAKAEWIISLDADEEISEELREEIKQLLKSNPSQSAFAVPRKTMHTGRWIQYGGWYPNYLIRLFRKGEGKWIGDELHERWQPKSEVGTLRGHILHHSFTCIGDQVERNNHYSSLGAEALRKSKVRFSFIKLIAKPFTKFVEAYFLKRGFLDGYAGFIIAVSAAYSVFLKWAKLWELCRDDHK